MASTNISDADVLSMSIRASAKKRKRSNENLLPKTRLSFDLRKGGKLNDKIIQSPPPISFEVEDALEENVDPQIGSSPPSSYCDTTDTYHSPVMSPTCAESLTSDLKSKLGSVLRYQLVMQLNTCSQEELRSFHGIGKVRSERILNERKTEPFTSLLDLSRIGMTDYAIKQFYRQNVFHYIEEIM